MEKNLKARLKLKSSLIGLVLTASAFTMQPALSLPPNPLFQNPLIWIGTPNPTPPSTIPMWEFQPLTSLPGFSSPIFGWMNSFNFESCVLGLSSSSSIVGPYGTAHNLSVNGCDTFASSNPPAQNPPVENPPAQNPTGEAGGAGATNAATGGLSNATVVTVVVVVGAGLALGLSGGDSGGSTGTTGTTGTR